NTVIPSINDTQSTPNIAFYAGFVVGTSSTLVITSIVLMIQSRFNRKRRLAEMEQIEQARAEIKAQLNKNMNNLANRFKQTAEAARESRIRSELLLIQDNND
ncbi:MAG: hypothetical protein AB1649_12625, partial [Chloroflexota bacterium]